MKALETECYIDAAMIREAVRRQGSFNVIHLETMFKDESLFLATAEDVILHKLHGYRLGGGVSDRQWMDVLGVLRVQGERLDYTYLERMAHQWGVPDLLAEAMKEASTDSSPM